MKASVPVFTMPAKNTATAAAGAMAKSRSGDTVSPVGRAGWPRPVKTIGISASDRKMPATTNVSPSISPLSAITNGPRMRPNRPTI